MKPLPNKETLRILWTVATSSAIEGEGLAYEIFARLLYQEISDEDFPVQLCGDG